MLRGSHLIQWALLNICIVAWIEIFNQIISTAIIFINVKITREKMEAVDSSKVKIDAFNP